MSSAADDITYVIGQDCMYRDLLLRNVDNSAAFIKHLLGPTTSVLDCGCGPGAITSSFKEICTDGNVVGIDQDPEAIQFASKRYPSGQFVTGNIDSLPFADDTFDVVYSHQVFQYVKDPVDCLVEMKRVCKRGGAVAVRLCDHEAVFWYPEPPGILRCTELFKEVNCSTGGDGRRGRKMAHLARLAGFEHIKKTVSVQVAATQKERKHWVGVWAGMFATGKLRNICEERGVLKENDLADIAEGFKTFEEDEGGMLVFPLVEILCTN